MAEKPIPFPHLDAAAEPEPIVKHRREIVIRCHQELQTSLPLPRQLQRQIHEWLTADRRCPLIT